MLMLINSFKLNVFVDRLPTGRCQRFPYQNLKKQASLQPHVHTTSIKHIYLKFQLNCYEKVTLLALFCRYVKHSRKQTFLFPQRAFINLIGLLLFDFISSFEKCLCYFFRCWQIFWLCKCEVSLNFQYYMNKWSEKMIKILIYYCNVTCMLVLCLIPVEIDRKWFKRHFNTQVQLIFFLWWLTDTWLSKLYNT